jgi:5-methylcytosine-specific restriction endonuclease McrA
MSLRLGTEEYHALWRSVLERDGWKCRRCGMRNNLHVHHIIFRSELGPDESWNLVTLCSDCHDAVHNYKLFIGVYGCLIGIGGGADGKLVFTHGC